MKKKKKKRGGKHNSIYFLKPFLKDVNIGCVLMCWGIVFHNLGPVYDRVC